MKGASDSVMPDVLSYCKICIAHQSSFVLGLGNHTKEIDKRWNLRGLGWKNEMEPSKLDSAYILHWTGNKKPWKKNGLFKEYFTPYSIPLQWRGLT